MNFQEWYKTMPKLTEPELRISVISWDACKKEVLKILRDKNNENIYDTDGGCASAISISVIREVEEL